MPAPIPEPKVNELIDQLNALRFRSSSDAFTLARLKAEAARLTATQATAADGYVALGLIAGLEGDEAGLRKHFENALRLNPGRRFVLHNYATALVELGRLDEALSVFEQRWKGDPMDLETFRETLSLSEMNGRFARNLQYAQQWITLTGNQAEEAVGDLEGKQRMLSVLQKLGVSEDAVAAHINGAAHALKMQRIRICGTAISYLPDSTVYFRFQIPEGDTRLEEASDALLEYRIAQDDPELDEVLTVSCERVTPAA